jgi:hypothetical protein
MAEYVYQDGKYSFEFDDNTISPVSLEGFSNFVEKCRAFIKEDKDNSDTKRKELTGRIVDPSVVN